MIKRVANKLFCPFVSSVIQLAVIYILFFQFFATPGYYKSSISNARIKARIESKLEMCKAGYFVSWIVIDSPHNYYFEDVIGFNSKPYSVKDLELNPFFNEESHHLDINTLRYLENFENGLAGYYDDLEFFKSYPAAYEIITKSVKNIKGVSISVVKDKKADLIYVFTLANTNEKGICDKEIMVRSLEDLSNYAKENL